MRSVLPSRTNFSSVILVVDGGKTNKLPALGAFHSMRASTSFILIIEYTSELTLLSLP